MRIFILILITGFFITSCTKPIPEYKNIFEAEFKTGPAAADRGPASFIRISNIPDDTISFILISGQQFRFHSKEDGSLIYKTDTLTTKIISKKDIEKLIELFGSNDFMSMNSHYKDPDFIDGDYKSIILKVDNFVKSVSCLNYNKQKQFNEIELAIKELAK